MKSIILVCAILLCVFKERETETEDVIKNTNSSKISNNSTGSDSTLNNYSVSVENNGNDSNITTTQAPDTTTSKPNTTLPTTEPSPITEPTPTSESSPSTTTMSTGGSTRRFDAPSFIGGMVLALGILAIVYVAFKFFKERTEQNYHTL